ncbi:MAG: GC-type dockerin domain-anchored protein [Phycisphaerales bacterium]
MTHHVPHHALSIRNECGFRPIDWLGALVGLTLSVLTFAQCDSSVAFHTGGIAQAVTVRGNFAYVSYPGEIRILEISTLATPTVVGSVLVPGFITDLDTSGNYLYGVTDPGEMVIVNIATLSSPSLVSVTPLHDPFTGADRIAASTPSGLALVVSGVDVEVWDVSTPTTPVYQSTYNPFGFAGDVEIQQTTGYVLVTTGEFVALDLANPASPVVLDSIALGSTIFEELARDGSILAANGWDQVSLIDATNPASLSMPWSRAHDPIVKHVAFGQAIGQRLLHYEEGDGEMVTYDATNIATPTFRSRTSVGTFVDAIAAANEKTIVLEGSDLFAYDFSSPGTPVLASTTPPSPFVFDVVVSDSHAIFASGGSLQVYNVATPANPGTPVEISLGGASASRLALAGTRLLVAGSQGASGLLRAYDISTPTAPVLLGSLLFPQWLRAIDVLSQRAYVVDLEGIVHVVDIADPAAMSSLGSLDVLSTFTSGDIAVWEGHAMVWLGYAGDAEIISIANPAAMSVVGAIEACAGESVQSAVVRDGYAFVGQSDERIDVYDLANPATPTSVANFSTDTYLSSLGMANSLLMVVDGDRRVRFVDTTNPRTPTFVGDVSLGGLPSQFARRGNTVWACDASYGIFGVSLPGFPRIGAEPVETIACPSTPNVTFSVNVVNPNAGSGATYQWRHLGIPLNNNATYSGVTTDTLTITNPGIIQAGNYSCDITNTCGSTTTPTASLTLALGLAILQQPQDALACPRASATFEIAGVGTLPVDYQWQRESPIGSGTFVDLSDATFPRFTVTGANDRILTLAATAGNSMPSFLATNFRCVASNVCNGVTSQPAALILCVADIDDGSGTGACDNAVTIDDLLYFLTLFQGGDAHADVDDGTGTGTTDGGVTIDDMLYYLQRFAAGC